MMLWVLTSLAYAGDEAEKGFEFGDLGVVSWAVILTLFGMLLVSLFVAIDRLIALLRARGQSMALAAVVVGPLKANDIAAAKKLTLDTRFKAGYLAGILHAGLKEMEERPDEHGVAAARRAVEKVGPEELSKLKRGMTLLATVASTGPFVGLFGTTSGVINAFADMSSGGSGLSSVSKGISEALVTTAIGIGVAVFAVWLFNAFNAWIDKFGEDIATSEADFIDWAEKFVLDRAQRAAK